MDVCTTTRRHFWTPAAATTGRGPPPCSTKGTISRHSSACGRWLAAIAAFRQRYGLRLARKPVGLTSRELEILGLLSLGRTNKEIADALCISSNTVAVHVARVLSKTGSSNRTEAASYAVRHHLIGETRALVRPLSPPTKNSQFW